MTCRVPQILSSTKWWTLRFKIYQLSFPYEQQYPYTLRRGLSGDCNKATVSFFMEFNKSQTFRLLPMMSFSGQLFLLFLGPHLGDVPSGIHLYVMIMATKCCAFLIPTVEVPSVKTLSFIALELLQNYTGVEYGNED